jgi:hypothetical protein
VYEDHLKMLEQKTQELQTTKSEVVEEGKLSHKYGTKISELATSLKDKYFDNEQFWLDIKKVNPLMLEHMTKLKSLTKTLHSEAQDSIFDLAVA